MATFSLKVGLTGDSESPPLTQGKGQLQADKNKPLEERPNDLEGAWSENHWGWGVCETKLACSEQALGICRREGHSHAL